jgi:hypothetical protein
MSAPKVKTGFKIFIALVIGSLGFFGFYKYAESQPEAKVESTQVIDSTQKETVQPVASTNTQTVVSNPVAVNTIVTTSTVAGTPVVAKASNNSDAVKSKKDKVAKVQEPTKKKKKSDDRENLNVNY